MNNHFINEFYVKPLQSITEFDGYQNVSINTAIYPNVGSNLNYTIHGITSEAGEISGKFKKYIRDGVLDYDGLIDELGDLLWYVAMAAMELKVPLSEVASRNLKKLSDRQKRNQLKGNGDNR